MHRGFTLDTDPFQKLLAAAWVIQRERNRELTKSIDRAIAFRTPREDELLAECPPTPRTRVLKVRGEIDEGFAPQTSTLGDPSVSSNWQVVGPLDEQTEVLGDQEQAVSAPTVISLKAILCVAAVLVIIIVFLISELALRQSGIVLVKTDRQIPATAADDSRTPQNARLVPPHEPAGSEDRQPEPSVFEPSHLRVTDPPTFLIVKDMSGPEMRTLRRQAKFGDGVAALILGMAYEIGHHVPQSCTQAAEWVATAAIEGNPAAEYNLALRYASGDGIPTNLDSAGRWLQEAASHGHQKAKLILQLADQRWRCGKSQQVPCKM